MKKMSMSIRRFQLGVFIYFFLSYIVYDICIYLV